MGRAGVAGNIALCVLDDLADRWLRSELIPGDTSVGGNLVLVAALPFEPLGGPLSSCCRTYISQVQQDFRRLYVW
jgi:hypothetical protein